MVFSSPSDNSGIVEKIDAYLGTDSQQYPLADKARDVNLGVDRVTGLILQAGGKWKHDDSNQEDYAIAMCDLTQGVRDYPFASDSGNNLVLEILRVFIKTQDSNGQSGIFQEIYPADPTSEPGLQDFTNGLNVQATPFLYEKLGTGIILSPVPSYSQADSLKVYYSREASYFTAADTTKKPGFAGLFHKYLAIYAAYEYATANSMSIAGGVLRNGAMTGLLREKAQMEADIIEFYGNRARDERAVMRGRRKRSK